MFSLMGTWVMLITLLIRVNLLKHCTSTNEIYLLLVTSFDLFEMILEND